MINPYGFYGGLSIEYFFLLLAIVLSMVAQFKVQSTFNKYLKQRSRSGLTGLDAARRILDRNGLYDVRIEMVGGKLSDHYDPRTRVLRLSRDVYSGTSIASIGVAAHEVGHAIQHAESYAPLRLRNAIVPVVNFGSKFVFILIMAGIVFSMSPLISLGVLAFMGIVIFQLVTLPVEFDASSRAIKNLKNGIISVEEESSVKKVLGAAAMTYVTAALVSIAQLVRLWGMSRRD
jgi:uncharacterized protein